MIRLEDSAPTVPALPVLSPITRLRRVRSLGQLVPELGVQITPTGNGHVAIELPAEVAELFLEDLHQRAASWVQAMQRSRLLEQEQQAQWAVERGQHAQRLEAQEDAWLAEYTRLKAEGKGHREALHRITGYDPTAPRSGQDYLPVQMVHEGIGRARSRAKAQAREHRTAEIVRLTREGLGRQEIADKVGLSFTWVTWLLKQAGVKLPDRRLRPSGGSALPSLALESAETG